MRSTTSNQKTALSIACTTHVVQDGLTSTIYVLLPILAQTFGFTYAQIGILKGLKNISQAVLEMCSGWLSERIGECPLIIVGLTLSGAGYLLLSTSPNMFLIAIFLVTIGAGTGLQHAPSSALIANSYPATIRSGALGLYNASGDIGKLVFTGILSLATGVGLAWQQISFFYGLAAVLAAVGIALATRSLLRQQKKTTNEASNAIGQPEIKGWGILHWRSFGALLVVTSIDTMVQTSVMVFVAFLMLAKGLSLPVATGATVLLLAGGIFGKAGCGYLANRMGVRPSFTLIQSLTALGLVAVVVAPNWLSFVLLMPLGAVLQGTSSITYSFAADLIDPRRMARGYALLYSVGTFASAVGPLAIGIVADMFGIEIAMYIIAIIAMLAVPPIFALREASHLTTKLT
jgi:MFS family permease